MPSVHVQRARGGGGQSPGESCSGHLLLVVHFAAPAPDGQDGPRSGWDFLVPFNGWNCFLDRHRRGMGSSHMWAVRNLHTPARRAATPEEDQQDKDPSHRGLDLLLNTLTYGLFFCGSV